MNSSLTPTAAMSYANFWKRVVATVIDTLVFIPMLGYISREPTIDPRNHTTMVILVVFMMALMWLYYAGMESSSSQATIGKKLMGIKVTDLEGNRIGFAQASKRYFCKILSKIIFYIGFIMAAFTQKKQGLHDILAKTLVLNQ